MSLQKKKNYYMLEYNIYAFCLIIFSLCFLSLSLFFLHLIGREKEIVYLKSLMSNQEHSADE